MISQVFLIWTSVTCFRIYRPTAIFYYYLLRVGSTRDCDGVFLGNRAPPLDFSLLLCFRPNSQGLLCRAVGFKTTNFFFCVTNCAVGRFDAKHQLYRRTYPSNADPPPPLVSSNQGASVSVSHAAFLFSSHSYRAFEAPALNVESEAENRQPNDPERTK